jgi:hypothetical protein
VLAAVARVDPFAQILGPTFGDGTEFVTGSPAKYRSIFLKLVDDLVWPAPIILVRKFVCAIAGQMRSASAANSKVFSRVKWVMRGAAIPSEARSAG